MKRRGTGQQSVPRVSLHGYSMSDARSMLVRRSGGRCELCSLPGTDAHHRQSRAVGDDCPCNLLMLCSGCHHGRVHEQPRAARGYGWILSRHGSGGAQFGPFWSPALGWVRPDCLGQLHNAVDPNP